MTLKRKFVLLHNRAPGDVVVLTALARDLKLAYPDCQIDVDTSAMDLWRHNPYLTKLPKKSRTDASFIKCQYGQGIREQNYETIHFLSYFHRDFEKQTRLKVPLTLPYPDLHLSPEERNVSLIDGRYWVVVSGGKSDFTAKVWHAGKFQAVVDRITHDLGLGVVQIGGTDPGHWHPPLTNVLNMVGETNLRDMLRLIYHADGVICGVSAPMHIAAALQRPCVVVAGGREPWWWEAYCDENKGFGPQAVGKLKVPHRFLHTIGLLDCCQHHGCWRNKVTKINDDKSLCLHPVLHPGQPVPLCMELISPTHAWEAVLSYYQDGTLPPTPAAAHELHRSPAGALAAHDVPPPPAAPPAIEPTDGGNPSEDIQTPPPPRNRLAHLLLLDV